MRELDITFELTPWEELLDTLQPGDRISALQVLALTQDLEEDTLLDELTGLEEKSIALDISGLPGHTGSGQSALRLRQEQQLAKQSDLLSGLEESDPLRLYLEELASIPAAGEEGAMALRYLDGEDVAESLVNLSLSRVVELAKACTGRGVLLMDLIQEGSLGLWQGVLSYTGGDFASHRDWWINQYLAKAVILQARSGELGQKLRQGMEDYRDVDQRLLAELGRLPVLEEIAQAMHITPEEAAVYSNMLAAAQSRQKTEQAREPAQPTEEDEQAVEDTAYFQLRQRILELLSTLTQTDAQLLTLRYGLEGGLPMSPQEVGNRLGLTPQEVMEREAQALAKLRQQG